MYHHSYLVLPPPRWGRVGVGVMRAESVDPVENRSNFPKLIFIVVIENEDVIMDLLAAVREAAKLIEAAQGRADPRPWVGYCPLQSLSGRGSLLSALLAARWCRRSLKV